MREKKFGKLFLTWLLAATMVLTLLPVSMLAADDADDGEAVLTPVAGAEAGETAVPAEAVPMLLATPAAADTPIAVHADKLIFDKANGVITGIDADWLANNKDKPLSVTIPAEINGTPVTSIGQNAFKAKNAGLKNHPQVAAVDFSNATNLEKIDNQAFMHSPVASVDLSNTQVTVIGKFAFGDCTSLENVILPNTLTVLGSSVFTDCKHVESIRLVDSPESVVFALPESLTSIGYQCFKNCFAPDVNAKVVIPASVETIEKEAFYYNGSADPIIQIVVKNKDISQYSGDAFKVYSRDSKRIIVLPTMSAYNSYYSGAGKAQGCLTYPVEITFDGTNETELHLNGKPLGYQLDNTTGFWELNDAYALPTAQGSGTPVDPKPGYEYVTGGGWKLKENDEVLDVTKNLKADQDAVTAVSGGGKYEILAPTISYLVDGESKLVDADQPFTVTIGDGKEHSIGIQVDHPLLKEKQGTDEDYVYFKYYWFDEVSLGDGKNTLNGPRSKEEQERFSTATNNVEIQYVDGEHNTIPIAKTEHARYEGSSYAGYNDYYLVVVFGYHVVNGDEINTPFYLSANNGIGVGNANATDGAHLLQVKVDEVRIITATAGEHGAIDPEGAVTVPKGESKTFTITPDSGYYIKDVLVDGKSVGAVSTYTFKEVVADHTIHAAFAKNHTPGHPTQPEQPKVEIPDEDALGLNTDDHFAYIIGYPDGTVQPNGQITRAEATTIFFRLLTEESRSANLTKTNGYTDVASDAWYNTAVSTMTKAGIVDGYPDGTFGPQRNITRAETATMINRVLDRVPSEESHLLSRGVMQIWPDANPGDWFYLAMQEATNSHDYERNAKWAAADEQWTALRETRDWKALEQ